MAEPYLLEVLSSEYDLKKVAAMVKTRISVMTEIKEQIKFFAEFPEYTTNLYTNKKAKCTSETSLVVLEDILPVLEKIDDFHNEALFDILSSYAQEKNVKLNHVIWPVRVAVSGKMVTLGEATEIMEILGKEESISRIAKGKELLES